MLQLVCSVLTDPKEPGDREDFSYTAIQQVNFLLYSLHISMLYAISNQGETKNNC